MGPEVKHGLPPSEAQQSHRKQHIFLIRQHTGCRFPTAQDKEELELWLRQEAAFQAHTADRLFDYACQRLRDWQVELPAEGELQRIVSAAVSGFFQDIHRRIAAAIPPDVRIRMDDLLLVPESGVVSGFEKLKADPGKPGVDNLQGEIGKLRAIRAVGLQAEPFAEGRCCKRSNGALPTKRPVVWGSWLKGGS